MHDYLGLRRSRSTKASAACSTISTTTGLDKNTIVVYSSDQGFFLGEHGWFDKRWIFEESLRAPLLVRWPGVTKPGSVNERHRLEPRLRRNVSGRRRRESSRGDAGPQPGAGVERRNAGRLAKGFYYHYYEHPPPHNVARHYGVVTDRYKLVHFYGRNPTTGSCSICRPIRRKCRACWAGQTTPAPVRELHAELTRLRSELKVPDHDPPGATGGPLGKPKQNQVKS